MKKLLAILVSIAMMLSSVAAFADAPAEALNVAAPMCLPAQRLYPPAKIPTIMN